VGTATGCRTTRGNGFLKKLEAETDNPRLSGLAG
jgi:hypothetical protein